MVMEFVDLGLSVEWATANYGADSPLEFGGYYTFEEAKELSLPNGVRLPTYEELQELIDSCDWKMVGDMYCLKGCKIYGPSGKILFLPAAGNGSPTANYGGDYWSGEDTDFGDGHALHFRVGEVYTEAAFICCEQSVRLVKDK